MQPDQKKPKPNRHWKLKTTTIQPTARWNPPLIIYVLLCQQPPETQYNAQRARQTYPYTANVCNPLSAKRRLWKCVCAMLSGGSHTPSFSNEIYIHTTATTTKSLVILMLLRSICGNPACRGSLCFDDNTACVWKWISSNTFGYLSIYFSL